MSIERKGKEKGMGKGKGKNMKRCLIILVCLSIILAGCQKSRESGTDRITPDNRENKIIDSSENETEDTAGLLLKLDEAWSVVQAAQVSDESYQEPVYETNVKSNKLEQDLSNLENIAQFQGFTKEQVRMLLKNGFIVLPSKDTRSYYVYDDNEYKGIPNFITTDAVLHLYHQFYDKSLMSVETYYLYDDLDLMTKQMLEKSILLRQMLQNEKLQELQEKNIIYFMVARMLMLQSENPEVEADAGLLAIAKQEYQLIQAAEGITKSPLLQHDLDYSQFTVRGHYTRSGELEVYFRTMMWLGLTPLAFVDENQTVLYDNVIQALLIAYTTMADSESVCDAQLWSDIYQPTSQYVGQSDDINVFTMNQLRMEVFGDKEDPNIYYDKEYKDKLIQAVKNLPEPRIQGKMTESSLATGKQFRFMGQRYVLDGHILQTLMKPVQRPIPTALDVMGVLGSETAESIIINDMKPQLQWPEYTLRYQEWKKEVSVFDKDYWQKNLYSGWLWTLKELLEEQNTESGLPEFMRTEAWKYKTLNTALGSYAELKHDTVLYGKQAMAQMGGPVATAQLHYVEPDVDLYSKLRYLTNFTCSILKDKGMLNEDIQEGADSYLEFLDLLISCSIKELKNETLTEEENQQLLWSGGTMETIMMKLQMGASGDIADKDATDMLVSDIATGNGVYLMDATGYFDHIYVVIPYDEKLYLSRGSVYSFYEFTGNSRLTDEEWWRLQGINVVHQEYDYIEYSEPSELLPDQPDWMKYFKYGRNDVTITPLEVDWEHLEE